MCIGKKCTCDRALFVVEGGAATRDDGLFFTKREIGSNRERTPEGFLLCRDVAVARVGEMIYGPKETPVPPGPDGLTHIRRTPDEVFCPISMMSLNGKPLTNDHPPVNVTPQNWKQYAGGIVLNPRRGVGADADLMLADVLVTDVDMIRDVEAGKVEVSCGYEPEYVVDAENPEPGVGYQTKIRYNHLALVRNGRCGERCAIGDQATVTDDNPKGKTMSVKNKTRVAFKRSAFDTMMDKLKGLVPAKDRAAFDEMVEEETEDAEVKEAPDAPVEIHNHTSGPNDGELPEALKEHMKSTDAKFKIVMDALSNITEKMEKKDGEETDDDGTISTAEGGKAILGQLELEAPPGTGDKARAATDSAYLVSAFRDTAAKAEILAPGIRLPALDAKAPPKKTFDSICGLRRSTLDLAYAQPVTRGIIDTVLAGQTLDTKNMSCDAIRSLFHAAAGIRAQDNNRTSTVDARVLPNRTGDGAVKITSLADINRAADERYKRKAV